MRGVAAGLVLIAALCVPVYFLVVNVPALIGLRLPVDRGSVAGIGLINNPQYEPTPTPGAPRFSPLQSSLPPTLAVPTRTLPLSSPIALGSTGERVVVGNTGGIGAAVRAEPRTGGQVAGMQDGEVADVLERQSVEGVEWVRVRTPRGQEGWILGRVAERLGPGTPVPIRPAPRPVIATPVVAQGEPAAAQSEPETEAPAEPAAEPSAED